MARRAIHSLLDHVRRLAGLSAPDAASDRQLLARLLTEKDGDALALLMHRHGPMVLGVARRVLREPHTAEDVFQATFLVLARRPAAVRQPESLGSWLHGVALRLAVRAKQRHAPEALSAEPPDPAHDDPAAELGWREFLAVLDEELQALPARYREPLVLCHLEGLTRDEAARQLGWSVGTLRRRVDAGRKLLHARLTRRGVALGVVLAGQLVAEAAPVPEALRAVTVASALGTVAVEESVAALADEGAGAAVGAFVVKPLVLAGAVVAIVGVGVWAVSEPDRATRPTNPVPKQAAPPPGAGVVRAADDAAFRNVLAGFEAWEGKTAWWVMQAAVLHARAGDPAAARRLFEQAARLIGLQKGSRRGLELARLAQCQSKAGNAKSAATTYAEVCKIGATLKAADRETFWLEVSARMAEAGRFDDAFDAAGRRKPHPRLWVVIATEQANDGDPAGALRTLDRIAAHDSPDQPTWDYFKLSAWRAIAAAQFRAGDKAAGLATLRRCAELVDNEDDESKQAWTMFREEMLDARADYAVAQSKSGDAAGARATLAKLDPVNGQDEWSQQVRVSLARVQVGTGDRAAAARTVAEFLRVWDERAAEADFQSRLDIQSNHRALGVMLALEDWDGPERLWRYGHMYQLEDLCEAMAKAGRTADALDRARQHYPDAGAGQAVALLGVARGVVERTAPGRPPKNDGAFAVRVPDPPAP